MRLRLCLALSIAAIASAQAAPREEEDWQPRLDRARADQRVRRKIRQEKDRQYASLQSLEDWALAFDREIQTGNAIGVESLVALAQKRDWDPDLEAPDKSGLPPLHRAIEQKNPGLVRALLQGGADPQTQDAFKRTATLHASVTGNAQVLQAVAESPRAQLNAPDENGNLPITEAVDAGCRACVEVLLKRGVPFPESKGKRTFAEWVLSRKRLAVLHAWLPTREARLNWRDRDGNTLLHLAAKVETQRLELALQEEGLSALQENKKGVSPVRVLLEGLREETFLEWAKKRPQLLQFRESDGTTLLHWAVHLESDALFEQAMKARISPSDFGIWKGTALSAARQTAEQLRIGDYPKKDERVARLQRMITRMVEAGEGLDLPAGRTISEKRLKQALASLRSAASGQAPARKDWKALSRIRSNADQTLLSLAIEAQDLPLAAKLIDATPESELEDLRRQYKKMTLTCPPEPPPAQKSDDYGYAPITGELLKRKDTCIPKTRSDFETKLSALYEKRFPLAFPIDAAAECKPSRVRELLDRRVIDRKKFLTFYLHLSIRCGGADEVADALKRGASVTDLSDDGDNAFHVAARVAPAWAPKALASLSKVPAAQIRQALRTPNGRGCHPLAARLAFFDCGGPGHRALTSAPLDAATIDAFLDLGADPNDASAGNPLLAVVLLQPQPKDQALEALLKRGADPNASVTQSTMRAPPLLVATGQANAAAVKLLLDHGANPKSLDSKEKDLTAYLNLKYALDCAYNIEACGSIPDTVRTLADAGVSLRSSRDLPDALQGWIYRVSPEKRRADQQACAALASRATLDAHYRQERAQADALLKAMTGALRKTWDRFTREESLSYRRLRSVLEPGKVDIRYFKRSKYQSATYVWQKLAHQELLPSAKNLPGSPCGRLLNEPTPAGMTWGRWICNRALDRDPNAGYASWDLSVEAKFRKDPTLTIQEMDIENLIRKQPADFSLVMKASLTKHSFTGSPLDVEFDFTDPTPFETQIANSSQRLLQQLSLDRPEAFERYLRDRCTSLAQKTPASPSTNSTPGALQAR